MCLLSLSISQLLSPTAHPTQGPPKNPPLFIQAVCEPGDGGEDLHQAGPAHVPRGRLRLLPQLPPHLWPPGQGDAGRRQQGRSLPGAHGRLLSSRRRRGHVTPGQAVGALHRRPGLLHRHRRRDPGAGAAARQGRHAGRGLRAVRRLHRCLRPGEAGAAAGVQRRGVAGGLGDRGIEQHPGAGRQGGGAGCLWFGWWHPLSMPVACGVSTPTTAPSCPMPRPPTQRTPRCVWRRCTP